MTGQHARPHRIPVRSRHADAGRAGAVDAVPEHSGQVSERPPDTLAATPNEAEEGARPDYNLVAVTLALALFAGVLGTVLYQLAPILVDSIP